MVIISDVPIFRILFTVVRDCNDTYITQKHHGVFKILFLATKKIALKSQSGTCYCICVIYSFSVD